MADAYECLDSLRHMLTVRRQETMEKMARGFDKEGRHHEHVGRCKELRETIDDITKQIYNINGGKDDETSSGK